MFGQVHRPLRARATAAKSTKGWASSAPRSKRERRALRARCGARAFLLPEGMKFPIMAKGSTSCAPDCRALRVAKQRAATHGYAVVERRAQELGQRLGCRWAR